MGHPGLWDPGKNGVSQDLGSSLGERVAEDSREGKIREQLRRGALSQTDPRLLSTGSRWCREAERRREPRRGKRTSERSRGAGLLPAVLTGGWTQFPQNPTEFNIPPTAGVCVGERVPFRVRPPVMRLEGSEGVKSQRSPRGAAPGLQMPCSGGSPASMTGRAASLHVAAGTDYPKRERAVVGLIPPSPASGPRGMGRRTGTFDGSTTERKDPSQDSSSRPAATWGLLEAGRSPPLWVLISPSVKAARLGQLASHGPSEL